MDGLFYVDTRAPHLSTDVGSVTLTAANKALIPVANIPPMGSNYFGYVGKAVRLTLSGRITTAATPGTGTFAFYWGNGADANGTIVLQSGGIVLVANQTNLSWRVEAIIRCRALGVSGSLIGTGIFFAHSSVVATPQMLPAATPAAVTVDLTAANILSPQFGRSGSTVESMQVHEVLYEALN